MTTNDGPVDSDRMYPRRRRSRVQQRSSGLTPLAICALFLVLLTGCGGGGGGSGEAPPIYGGLPKADLDEAALFLSQAGFGGNAGEIQALAGTDFEVWLDTQFSIAPTLHSDRAVRLHEDYCTAIAATHPTCEGPDVLWPPLFRTFVLWETVVAAPDQLHQKVAYALSQIFVVSDRDDNLSFLEAMTHWWDTLLMHGTGNYRDLLRAVTLSPAMGVYLSHYLNGKGDPAQGIFPDENYAREVMQLFSIGLYELNPDGSRKKDGNGKDIPTYNNADIREFAKVFTGLANGCGDQEFLPWTQPDFTCPMRMYEEHHATGIKTLLNGDIVPDGLTGMEDVEQAIDNLYNHPNVGPFIGRLLIQRLVTSNPSPQYIARVSAAFADNGDGVRGDMKAVIKAVLLDPEARGRTASYAQYGKVRDPFLRFAHLYRALELSSSTGDFYMDAWALQTWMKQFPLSSPSVFNFYSPDHVPFGVAGDAGLYAPELQIANAASVPGYYNYLESVVMWDNVVMWFTDDGPPGFVGDLTLDYAPVTRLLPHPRTLADYLDTLFTHGTMSRATRKGIADFAEELELMDATQEELISRAVVYLTLTAPEYLVRQ